MIKFCLDRAAKCRRGAEQDVDPDRRQFWLKTEGQWFFLARSYATEQQLNKFPRHPSVTPLLKRIQQP
jgi:hypothetical protein